MSKDEDIVKGLLKGIPVSEGIAVGKAWIVESLWDEAVKISLPEGKIDHELERYKNAMREASIQLGECRDRVQKEIGLEEAEIFNAHLAILKDPFFQKEIPDLISNKKQNSEFLLKIGIEEFISSFSKMKNEYFLHRQDDIKDVAHRLLRILLQSEEAYITFDEPVIMVAHNLTPSETARIDQEKILGFATEFGGVTSHVSILAHSMGLPAVVGVKQLMKKIKKGDTMVVDGNSGIVYINPPERILQGYKERKKEFDIYHKRLCEDTDLSSETSDGSFISLQANVSMTADVSIAMRYRADGIGLFRTELPFLIAGRLLSETEQFQIYKTVIETMKGKIVTIRTLDLGGDKFLPFQDVEHERNPFLGWRSIRIFLQEVDIFKTQIRAILRASVFGQVKILFPMISSLQEIIDINELIEEVKTELQKEKKHFDQKIQIGIMIEVPSAAILADRLIQYVDFFSIGTNDLIQYTLAVDRNNEKVAKFYKTLNPSVLRLIHMTIRAAKEAAKDVSLCGEMAGNPLYTALLIGMGLRKFSMSPMMLPEVKERVRAISIEECETLANQVLEMSAVEEIEKVLTHFHKRVNKRQTVPCLEV